MHPVFSHQWFLAILAVVIITMFVFIDRKRPTAAHIQRKFRDVVAQRIVEVQFDIVQIPAIRLLLGSSTADTLLDGLAREVRRTMDLAYAPKTWHDSITLAFYINDADQLAESINKAVSALSQTIIIDEIRFCCDVKVKGLKDHDDAIGHDNLGPAHGEVARLALVRELMIAIDRDRLSLSYQPKLDLRTGKICSVEALLRWTHANGEVVHIGDLIDVVERTGTMKELTNWVLNRAIKDSEDIIKAGFKIRTFINISGSLLSDKEFANAIIAAVANTRVEIGIEVTETAVIADPETAIQNLRDIANAGIDIAIDDFGVGLSSLEYLQQLPASELKIDRTFIEKLSSSNRNPLIVRATIDLAHAMEMRVTAEGVDDQLSIALLRIMGCDMAQGYLISPALPLADLLQFLDIHQQSQIAEQPLPTQEMKANETSC